MTKLPATGPVAGIGAGPTGLVIALSDVTLLSPLPNPGQIICVGLNYLSHIKETGRDKPTHPSIFTRYPSSVLGLDVSLIRPKMSQKFDYEGELAVIIGKEGRHIYEGEAWNHIAGYGNVNDGSIRDYQVHTSQFWPGKSFDDTGSMGPWIVTRDETGDIVSAKLETRIDGETVQSTTIDDLAITIPEIIAYVSTVTKLLPGDVIASGTPGGVDRFREPPLYLSPGMTCGVEITVEPRAIRDRGRAQPVSPDLLRHFAHPFAQSSRLVREIEPLMAPEARPVMGFEWPIPRGPV